jgi:hypothetical protein
MSALGAAAGLFTVVMMAAAARGPAYDLAPLPAAGRLIAAGEADHLYAQHPIFYNRVDDPVFRRGAASAGFAYEPTPFVYPPLVAWLLAPFESVSFAALERTWAALSVVFVLIGVYLVIAVYVPKWCDPLAGAGVLLALCAYEPLRYGFWLGQTTSIIFPLVIGAVALQRHERPRAAGLMLAVAAFIKITPAALALVWLWRGPRRAAAWCAIGLAVLWLASLAVLGTDIHRAYLARVHAISQTSIVAYNNHSVPAFVSRFWQQPTDWLNWRMHETLTMPSTIAAALLAVAAILAFTIVRRIPESEPGRWRPCAEGFALLAMLAVPNIAWSHYFVFLLPVMAIAVNHRASRESLLAAGGAFLLCVRPLVAPQELPPVWATNALQISGPTVALAMLFVVLAHAGLTARKPETG